MRKYDASIVADGMTRFLSREPGKLSKSRIKHLRGGGDPDYRLRIGIHRVFYNVDMKQRQVLILRVLHKDDTRRYYEEVKK